MVWVVCVLSGAIGSGLALLAQTGPKGPQGERGPRGHPGKQGPEGPAGESAGEELSELEAEVGELRGELEEVGGESSQVGELYLPGDPRRDRAYSIFYVGINIGAFFAPLVCGTLGERVGWHYGFGAAGVGMLIGLLTYLAATPSLRIRRLSSCVA